MVSKEVIRNAAGQPFSKWKPTDKLQYMLEAKHFWAWSQCQMEHVFDATRKWRFDFAWPPVKLAVEVDGFGYGHQAQQNIAAGHEKQNAATEQGWRVLRYCSRQLGSKAGVELAAEQIACVLSEAKEPGSRE